MTHHKTYKFIAAGVLTLSLAAGNIPALAAENNSPVNATVAEQASAVRVIEGVHTDAVSAGINGSQLELFSYADLPEGNRTKLDPKTTVFHIPDNEQTRLNLPAGYEFVAPAGTSIIYAPQTQIQGVLWPGWNTEDIMPGQVQNDTLTMELTKAETPKGGSVEIFKDNVFGGPERVWSSDEAAFRTYQQPVHAHVHGNWAFTKPGVYKLTYRVSGTLTDGTPVSADQTYTFAVGDVPDEIINPQPEATETPKPTAEPTEEPTVEPTTDPTDIPSVEPTIEPTVEPTAEPTVEAPAPKTSETQTSSAPAPAKSETAQTAPVKTAPKESEAPTKNNSSNAASDPGNSGVTNSESTGSKSSDLSSTNSSSANASDTNAVAPAPNAFQGGSSDVSSSSGAAPGSASEKCFAQEEVIGKVAPSSEEEKSDEGNAKPASLNKITPGFTLQTAANHTDRALANSGHFDFGAVLKGGNLTAQIKDDRHQPASWVAPSSLNFVLGDKATMKMPAGNEKIAPAGSEVYLIGATQVDGVPWLGWNTQNPELINKASGPATLSLKSVDGPGKLSVFLAGNFGSGNQTVFDSESLGSFKVPMNTHQHGNWVFTKPGEYTVRVGWSVPMKDGSTKTAEGTLHFTVGKAGEKSADQGGAQKDSGHGESEQKSENAGSQASTDPASLTGTVDEKSGVITKSDGTQVRIVGKTASGEDCTLSADELASAQQASAAGKLAYTGFNGATLALVGGSAVLAGAIALFAIRRRKTA